MLHLLYARFWHKVLFDLGVVQTDEPFRRLVSQGMILGEVEYTARQDAGGNWCNEDEDGENSSSTSSVVRIDPSDAVKSSTSPTGLALASAPEVHVSARAHKMSKSRGNVVNPDDVVAEFGADSLRLYEMFMGPLRETKVRGLLEGGVGGWVVGGWEREREREKGVPFVALKKTRCSSHLFLSPTPTPPPTPPTVPFPTPTPKKVWSTRSVDGDPPPLPRPLLAPHLPAGVLRGSSSDQRPAPPAPLNDQARHRRDRRAAVQHHDLGLMEFVNGATKWDRPPPQERAEDFALLLAPYAPHLAEEAWEHLDGEEASPSSRRKRATKTEELMLVLVLLLRIRRRHLLPPLLLHSHLRPLARGRRVLAGRRDRHAARAGQREDARVGRAARRGRRRGRGRRDGRGEGIPAVARLLEEEGAKVARVVFVPGRIINFIVVGGGGGGGGGRGKKKKKS